MDFNFEVEKKLVIRLAKQESITINRADHIRNTLENFAEKQALLARGSPTV